MNAKGGALAIIAFFTLIGIAEYYTVQCFMRYYYVKKYDLADAINIVEEASKDDSKNESCEEPKEKKEV